MTSATSPGSSRFPSDGAEGESRYPLRLATEADVPALAALIELSTRILQAPYYSPAQLDAALGPIFGVDGQLIRDGTYFVAEDRGEIAGCGGWSRRLAVFGGDALRQHAGGELDPARDPARIRAFFVHPDHARRGIGRRMLSACETALQAAGFREAVLVATLAGEPLYAAAGYAVTERYDVSLTTSLTLPVVRMAKTFSNPAADAKR
jgi:GNAT superfamily N-acetyltransferase